MLNSTAIYRIKSQDIAEHLFKDGQHVAKVEYECGNSRNYFEYWVFVESCSLLLFDHHYWIERGKEVCELLNFNFNQPIKYSVHECGTTETFSRTF